MRTMSRWRCVRQGPPTTWPAPITKPGFDRLVDWPKEKQGWVCFSDDISMSSRRLAMLLCGELWHQGDKVAGRVGSGGWGGFQRRYWRFREILGTAPWNISIFPLDLSHSGEHVEFQRNKSYKSINIKTDECSYIYKSVFFVGFFFFFRSEQSLISRNTFGVA